MRLCYWALLDGRLFGIVFTSGVTSRYRPRHPRPPQSEERALAETPPQSPLVPVEERTIAFYGDALVALRDAEGGVWVPVRRLCEALGVDRRGQMARIDRDPVLSKTV